MADPQASAASLALGHRVAPNLPKIHHVDQTAEKDSERPHSTAPEMGDSSDILCPLDDANAWRGPSPRRRAIAYAVIAILLLLFALIVFFGLVQSVWWY